MMMMQTKVIRIIASSCALCLAALTYATSPKVAPIQSPHLNLESIYDASSLNTEVLQNWHLVEGTVATRQKLITIEVGELWPGQVYRIPVRLIVPADQKAAGFHLTGGHHLKELQKDAYPKGVETELLKGGIGLVYTIIQNPKTYGEGVLAEAMQTRFIETLDPQYSIQYWAWPTTLMRAITAADAEIDHFEAGKIAASGSSKNGASPTIALLHDPRITAVFGSVSPIYDSPLRLCDREAWDALEAFEKHTADASRQKSPKKHRFLGGTFGPVYNEDALQAGHTWSDLKALAERLADGLFISRNLDTLKARGVDLYFHPGTHDFVAYDLSWGGAHYPQILVYLGVNTGHGKKKPNPGLEKDEANKSAFLLEHFFDEVEPLLESPKLTHTLDGNMLRITVQFPEGSVAESGRLYWMYDRAPDGTTDYLKEPFPADQLKEMYYNATEKSWILNLELESGHNHIDLFSNHRKTISYKGKTYATYLSSPYTRISLMRCP